MNFDLLKDRYLFKQLCPLQNVNDRNSATRFSCSRCHNDQGFSLLFVETITYGSCCFLNKRSIRNGRINSRIGYLFQTAANNKRMKFVLGVIPENTAGRVARAVNHPYFIAVGVEDNGANSPFLLDTIGIKFRLLTAFYGIYRGLFRFDNGKGLVVIAEKNIIGISYTLVVRHSVKFYFNASRVRQNCAFNIVNLPPRLTQSVVYVNTARFRLCKVRRRAERCSVVYLAF